MFPVKNFSPQQVACYYSFADWVAWQALQYILMQYKLVAVLLCFCCACIVVRYLLIYFMVQRFVYRKIKLIYKLIYQTKASKREEFYYKNILTAKKY